MLLKISYAKFGQDQPNPGWFLPHPGPPLDPPLKEYSRIMFPIKYIYICQIAWWSVKRWPSPLTSNKQTNQHPNLYYINFFWTETKVKPNFDYSPFLELKLVTSVQLINNECREYNCTNWKKKWKLFQDSINCQ